MASPAWKDDRTVFAVVGDRGFIDVWSFPLDEGEPAPVTRTTGAALAPAPAADSLFYLSLEPDGLDLRRLDLSADHSTGQAAVPPADLPADLAPVVSPPPVKPAPFAVAPASESRPYGLGRQELLPLIGGGTSSSGGSFETGVRGGDLVGRLDWLALASFSEVEGGAVAAVWRGWPVEAGFHLFKVSDRQGVELSLRKDWLWSGGAFRLIGRTLAGQIEPAGGRSLDQRMTTLSTTITLARQHGPWRLETGFAADRDQGWTGGESWSRTAGRLRLGLKHDHDRLALTWSHGTSNGIRQPFDLFELGGAGSSVLPDSALSGRIFDPALPAGLLSGTDFESERTELDLGFLPAPVFFERYRLWSGSSSRDWLSLAGLEWRWSTAPIPLARIPALDVRLGVARVLDDPLKDATRWWLVTVWRP